MKKLVLHLSVIVCTTIAGVLSLLYDNPELAGTCFAVLGIYASSALVVESVANREVPK